MSYQRRKDRARQEAIEWLDGFADRLFYWGDMAVFTAYFYRIGKRYGLLTEFRENGIPC